MLMPTCPLPNIITTLAEINLHLICSMIPWANSISSLLLGPSCMPYFHGNALKFTRTTLVNLKPISTLHMALREILRMKTNVCYKINQNYKLQILQDLQLVFDLKWSPFRYWKLNWACLGKPSFAIVWLTINLWWAVQIQGANCEKFVDCVIFYVHNNIMQQICAKTHANFEVGNMVKKHGWINAWQLSHQMAKEFLEMLCKLFSKFCIFMGKRIKI